ncbi:MAG TPA: hypothetical protein VN605_14895, partial [Thermoanaerobaculia bacterium]|nr:hypothetical protein [Thermoanaerobaculia bacterium]
MSIREQAFRCPDPETIAALTEGRIAEADLDSILEHVESCPSCLEGLELATRAMAAEAMATHRAPRFPMWLAVAAAFVLAILGGAVWQWSARQRGPAMADLVKLAPADARLVEPRLSAAFAYGPYRGPMRASGSVTDAQRLRLGGVAANALEQADRDPSPESQHVAGVAMLLADDPLKAAERLRLASERAPNDARMASDLAAAQYAAAETLGRASLLPEALAAADQALRADPNLAAASFNRALILDRLGLEREARRAWERYLAIDPASPWAGEARRRLARLPRAAAKPLPSLDRAVQANDRSAVRAIVGQATQQARTTAEAEHLGQWGEAIVRGDRAEAARRLMLARATGEALRSISTESLLHDAVIAIDGAGPARELALARAHAVYRQGRMAYSRELLEDAARDLHAAASGFAAAASPMELVARYYAANVLFERGEIARAREELEELLRISDGHPAYLALRAQIRWQLALCAMDDDDWTMASARLAEAEALFAGLEERGNLAFVRSMLATTLMSSGKPDDAWSARMHAFAALSEEDQGHRLAVALSAAARMEQRAGRPDAARALLGVEVEEARQSGNAFL